MQDDDGLGRRRDADNGGVDEVNKINDRTLFHSFRDKTRPASRGYGYTKSRSVRKWSPRYIVVRRRKLSRLSLKAIAIVKSGRLFVPVKAMMQVIHSTGFAWGTAV